MYKSIYATEDQLRETGRMTEYKPEDMLAKVETGQREIYKDGFRDYHGFKDDSVKKEKIAAEKYESITVEATYE